MGIRWLWGTEVAIRKTSHLFKSILLRIATSAPLVLLNDIVIPNVSEGSPSPIPVLTKINLPRTFFKLYIICDLLNVVLIAPAGISFQNLLYHLNSQHAKRTPSLLIIDLSLD